MTPAVLPSNFGRDPFFRERDDPLCEMAPPSRGEGFAPFCALKGVEQRDQVKAQPDPTLPHLIFRFARVMGQPVRRICANAVGFIFGHLYPPHEPHARGRGRGALEVGRRRTRQWRMRKGPGRARLVQVRRAGPDPDYDPSGFCWDYPHRSVLRIFSPTRGYELCSIGSQGHDRAFERASDSRAHGNAVRVDGLHGDRQSDRRAT